MISPPPKVVDLFAGAGGFSLGFQQAGFELVGALELDRWACDTLHENHADTPILRGDIREFGSSSSIRDAFPHRPDVVIGGPPCQGFSHAGPTNKDPRDPRNSLFRDFARWVAELEPAAFVMENVKGLLRRKTAEGIAVPDIIRTSFSELGYSVDLWILNAADYGVPQARERVFFVGHRSDGVLPPPIRTHCSPSSTAKDERRQLELPVDAGGLEPHVCLWEAISDLPALDAGEGEEVQSYTRAPKTKFQAQMRGDHDTLFNHVAMNHSQRMVERFKHIDWGESGADVPPEHLPRSRNGDGKRSVRAYDQNNRRLHPHRPSHTIAASFYANFVHPFQHRNITAREGARVQSFPDSYRFMGRKTVVSRKLLEREGRHSEQHLCQYNQIGNAVPPILASAIARHLMSLVLSPASRR